MYASRASNYHYNRVYSTNHVSNISSLMENGEKDRCEEQSKRQLQILSSVAAVRVALAHLKSFRTFNMIKVV